MRVLLSFFFRAQINHIWPLGSPALWAASVQKMRTWLIDSAAQINTKQVPLFKSTVGISPLRLFRDVECLLLPHFIFLTACLSFSLSIVENKPLSCPKLQLVQTCVWAAVESSQGPSCADGTAGVLLAWLNYSELQHTEGNPTRRLKGPQFFKGSDNIEPRYRRTRTVLSCREMRRSPFPRRWTWEIYWTRMLLMFYSWQKSLVSLANLSPSVMK